MEIKLRIDKKKREIEILRQQIQQLQTNLQVGSQKLIASMGALEELESLLGEEKNEENKGNESRPVATEGIKK